MPDLKLRFLLPLVGFVALQAAAAEDTPALMPTDVVPTYRTNPDYPDKFLQRRQEGWVAMSFVIDVEGEVADVIAVDSSDKGFEVPAIAALSKWKYDPVASNIGQTGSSAETVFKFSLEPTGITPKFLKSYQVIEPLLNEGKTEDARERLADAMEQKKSAIDNVLYNWLSFRYSTSVNDSPAAYDALGDLLANSDSSPNDMLVAAFANAFALASNNNKLQEAKDLLIRLQASEQAKTSSSYEAAVNRLTVATAEFADRLASGRPLEVAGTIRGSYWKHVLSHTEFSLSNVTGNLEGIEARCRSAKGQHLEITMDSGYKIPESWGRCNLYIKGGPGTSFTLIEYPAASPQ